MQYLGEEAREKSWEIKLWRASMAILVAKLTFQEDKVDGLSKADI